MKTTVATTPITLNDIIALTGDVCLHADEEYINQILRILLRASVVVMDESKYGVAYRRMRLLIFSYLNGDRRYIHMSNDLILDTKKPSCDDVVEHLIWACTTSYAYALAGDETTSIDIANTANTSQHEYVERFFDGNKDAKYEFTDVLVLYKILDIVSVFANGNDAVAAALKTVNMAVLGDNRLYHIATWLPLSLAIGNRLVAKNKSI